MPELPEVEFARRTLAAALEGARVTMVRAEDRRVAPVQAGEPELAALVGSRCVRVERRGKRLRLTFEGAGAGARAGEDCLLAFSHLGMTGRWTVVKAGGPPLPYERARVEAKRGSGRIAVAYVDPRRFGRIVVAREDIRAWRELGPDPVQDGIDAGRLFDALHARRRSVKEALLDQRILAGVGNIHAVEALWRARIDPRSRTDALTLADVRALARGIRASLAFGIRDQQSRADVEYVGESGGSNPYRVYDRRGPCPRCGHLLSKIVMGGRGTTFCPGCQARVDGRRPR